MKIELIAYDHTFGGKFLLEIDNSGIYQWFSESAMLEMFD